MKDSVHFFDVKNGRYVYIYMYIRQNISDYTEINMPVHHLLICDSNANTIIERFYLTPEERKKEINMCFSFKC